MSSPVITLLDIETAPTLGYVWQMYEANVIATKDNWFILSYAYKTLGKGKTTVRGLPDFKSYKKDMQSDRQLVLELWKLFDRSDIIIAHNGDRFDIRKINARFIFHGLVPPSPYVTIDTLKIARKHFKFDSNRLSDLAEYLGIGSKLPHEGFKHTWLECMAGVKRAWRVMKRYNAHDVFPLLEGVYLKLRPWATKHPNLDMYAKSGRCTHCDSSHFQRRGYSFTRTGQRVKYHCNSCGAWFLGIKHERTV